MDKSKCYETLFPKLVGFLIKDKRLGKEDSEDLAQDSFLVFYEKYKCDDLEEKEAVNILFSIAENLFLNHYRKNKEE